MFCCFEELAGRDDYAAYPGDRRYTKTGGNALAASAPQERPPSNAVGLVIAGTFVRCKFIHSVVQFLATLKAKTHANHLLFRSIHSQLSSLKESELARQSALPALMDLVP